MLAEKEDWSIPDDDNLVDTDDSEIKLKIRQMQESLPIYEYKKELISTILNHDMVVITGETGSGKSTQLP